MGMPIIQQGDTVRCKHPVNGMTDGPFRVLKVEWWMGGVPVLYIQDLATGQFGNSAGYFAWRFERAGP